MRRPDCEPFCSVILRRVVVGIATCRGAQQSHYKDIERVSRARALDLAPEPDDGYDLMEQLARGEPPEIHWP